MRYNEMKRPLIQSGLVLIVILVFIGFVAGSDAHGFFAGIAAIIKGALYTILFLIALTIGLLVCCAILFALFIGAQAIHSPSKAKETYQHLKNSLSLLVTPLCHNCQPVLSPLWGSLQSRLSKDVPSTSSVPEEENTSNAALLSEKERQIEELSLLLAQSKASMQSLIIENTDLKMRLEQAQNPPEAKEHFPNPQFTHALFKYIETETEKEKIASLIAGAVEDALTYAETDQFLEESLPVELVTILKAHPSLTRDYIRTCRNLSQDKG